MTLAFAAPTTEQSSGPAATADRTSPAVAGGAGTPRNPLQEDRLVREHLPLVGYLVREMLGRLPVHVSRDDLVSAGMFALAASARSWEPDRGVPFGRFAAIRIRGALLDELRSRDWASRAVRSRAREVDEVRGELAVTLSRSPSTTEVASAMGCDVREVTGVEADVRRAAVLSLQALTADGSDVPVADVAQPETLLLQREQLGYLRDAIAELPERLRTVIVGHFFEQRTMADMSAELGVTESRISQVRSEALSLLRDALRSGDGPDAPAAPGRPPARAGSRAAVRSAYCAAVAARSTLADRLAATTALGEIRAAGGGDLRPAK